MSEEQQRGKQNEIKHQFIRLMNFCFKIIAHRIAHIDFGAPSNDFFSSIKQFRIESPFKIT